MLRWAGRKYVVNGTTMTVEVNCHYRPKEQCPTTPGSKSPAWCPQNLVLLFQDTVPALYPLRVYMTEGPRKEKYPGFTDSYEVILDTGYQWGIGGPEHLSNEAYTPIPTSKVIVCCGFSMHDYLHVKPIGLLSATTPSSATVAGINLAY